jgi:hypothetical protein
MSRSLTYVELAEALKITPASASSAAATHVRPSLPFTRSQRFRRARRLALVHQDSHPVSPTDSPSDSPPDKLIKALEAHIETLRAQLAAAEARAEGLTAERNAERDAERAKAEKAIAEFVALAHKLATLASERARRPWWRRLAG